MTLIADRGTSKISREELCGLPVPAPTATHKPVPHHEVVEALVETLGFRHIAVARDEYAVSPDGMRMFGALDLDYEYSDVRFSIGIRNSNDKSMRLGMTIGYKVTICSNMMFKGDFTPVMHKHTRRLDLADIVSVGVDKMQRNFEPLQAQIDDWHDRALGEDEAKLVLYRAFVKGPFPLRLLPRVHQAYFEPAETVFRPGSFWSLSNAFTSTFKTLLPMRQFQLPAKLGTFLEDC